MLPPPAVPSLPQGYSSTAMALALPPHGKLVTCDRNDKVIELAKTYWAAAGVADKARDAACRERSPPPPQPPPFPDKPPYVRLPSEAVRRIACAPRHNAPP